MAFCSYCGKELVDGKCDCEKFVANNPEPQENNTVTPDAEVNSKPETSDVNNSSNASLGQSDKPKSNSKIGVIIGACAGGFILLLLIFFMTLGGKKTVDLSKYVTIEYKGYNGYATATYSFDKDSFVEDNKSIKLTSEGEKEVKEKIAGFYGTDKESIKEFYRDFYGADNPSGILYTAVASKGNLDNYSGLSNGDVITFSWDLSDSDIAELEKILKVKIKCKEKTETVEGLEDVEVFDPFEGLEVTFEGVAPDGIVRFNSPYAFLYYSADKESGLSNGDIVTISITSRFSEEEVVDISMGEIRKVPSSFEKQYEVSGLPAYAQSVSEISDRLMDDMIDQAYDSFDAFIIDTFDNDEYLMGREYVGNFFLTSKDSSVSDKNILNVIIKARVVGEKELLEFYQVYQYKNVMSGDDSSYAVSNECKLFQNIFSFDAMGDQWFEKTIYGFKTERELKDNLVVVNADKYEAEDNFDESKAEFDDYLDHKSSYTMSDVLQSYINSGDTVSKAWGTDGLNISGKDIVLNIDGKLKSWEFEYYDNYGKADTISIYFDGDLKDELHSGKNNQSAEYDISGVNIIEIKTTNSGICVIDGTFE